MYFLAAPGWPPENVYAANKTTPTMIPVSWRPIANHFFVHGILRGYTVTYQAVRNPNKEIEEKPKHVIVGRNTLSVELHGLSSFTIYSIEVSAFTVKGNGTPSQVIFGGEMIIFLFQFQGKPTLSVFEGNVLVLFNCCSSCNSH